MQTSLRARKRSAFTIIELLVVVTIILILAGLLMPAVSVAMRKAHESATLNLIHQCEMAAQAFFNDYGDYPPSTWSEIDTLFDTEPWNLFVGDEDAYPLGHAMEGDYRYNTDPDWDGPYYGEPVANHALYISSGTNPSSVNEGIEVFLACLATQNGGAYLEPSDNQLANTDADNDSNRDTKVGAVEDPAVNDVFETTNWYFGGNQVFELVDWWGNPLVYLHNREYTDHDGTDGGTYVSYADMEGTEFRAYGRSTQGFETLQYPNLSGFQLFSLGWRGVQNPNLVDSGLGYYSMPGNWSAPRHDYLCNWEE